MYGFESVNTSGNSPRVISGRSLVHRHLNARQRAAIAADILAGRAIFQPSNRQLAQPPWRQRAVRPAGPATLSRKAAGHPEW
jgi:hypothetical protein